MRIAVVFHAQQTQQEAESEYVIGRLAAVWRRDGHDVKFLLGYRERWPADVAIIHVDLSLVPRPYISFGRSYPVVLNDRIVDIRKRSISRNLVDAASDYRGPVFVKTDLNSAGIPERKLEARAPWRVLRRRLFGNPEDQVECVKNYAMYESLASVPADVRARPGVVFERFVPEVEGGLYFTRRCFVLGDRAMSHRIGYPDATGAGAVVAFEWIDNAPDVLAVAREVGLDYGVIDYTCHEGRSVILDVNKTIGIGRMQDPDERANYHRLIDHLAAGLYSYVPATRATVAAVGAH